MDDARRRPDDQAVHAPCFAPFVRRLGVAGAGVALVAVVATALAVPRVARADCELIISEYVEGSALNKVIEIQNALDSPLDLAAGGYQIVIYLNGCTASSTTIDLVGTIPPHDAFVLAHPRAAASILPLADQLADTLWFDGDDALALVKPGGVILDVVGQIGFDPGLEWGSGSVSTADNTLRRQNGVAEGDHDGSDPFDPATGWDGYATNSFDNLGVPNAAPSCGPTGVSNSRGDPGTRLYSPRPNPSGVESRLGFSLRTPGTVRMVVADVASRLVRVLAQGQFASGAHVVHWDGRDDAGRPVGSGVYFVRLESGGTRLERTLIRINR